MPLPSGNLGETFAFDEGRVDPRKLGRFLSGRDLGDGHVVSSWIRVVRTIPLMSEDGVRMEEIERDS